MDRKTLEQQLENEVYLQEPYEGYSIEELKNVAERAMDTLDKPGLCRGHFNLVITMEELAELQKEISKYLRGKGDKLGIAEEMADVLVSLQFMYSAMEIDPKLVEKIIDIKIHNLNEIINNGSFH